MAFAISQWILNLISGNFHWQWSPRWPNTVHSILINFSSATNMKYHSKHPLPTTQEKSLHMAITRWSIPKSDWLYSCSQRWRSSIQSAKTRPGVDCGLEHELLIAKFRGKLKKVGKTTRPFRYELNEILSDCTVEVTNRLKGLDLIDRVPEDL